LYKVKHAYLLTLNQMVGSFTLIGAKSTINVRELE